MKVFVIIVTYNGQIWYDRCFTSLRNSEIFLQTVVVDNASKDGTVKYILENYPEIHLITSIENLGFGQGNNKGIRYALDNDADYVFLLNQDAWIEPNTIKSLVEIHKKNQEYGILSVMNVTKEKDSLLTGFINYLADYKNCDPQLFDDLYWGRLKDVYQIKMILAAAWLLPRKTIETIGGFDPIFFHYGEDDNYAQRVNYHGLKIGICPKLFIVHDAQTLRTDNAIEFRKKALSDKRNLLLEYCDINKCFKIFQVQKYHIKKIVRFLSHCDMKNAMCEIMLVFFVLKNTKRIIFSRKVNLTINSNWL